MSIPLIVHIIVLLSAMGFTGILLRFKYEYSYEKDNKRFVIIVFLITTTVLMALSTIAFFAVPWDVIISLTL